MPKYKLEPDAEVSGTYQDGSTWLATFGTNGTATTTDETIAATLQRLADDPDNPVSEIKAKG